MRNKLMIVGALTLLVAACNKKDEKKDEAKMEASKAGATDPNAAKPADPNAAKPADPNAAKPADPTPVAATGGKKLFLDEHDIGPGKVNAAALAEAHKKDLATQGKYGVEYKAYWFDEKEGKVYCLSEAPSAEAANNVHKEAHGLVAQKTMEVSSDNTNWMPSPGKKLFLDVHHLPPGKVTAEDLAGAHKKDLAAQDKHDVKYLNYWFDKDSGTVMCLSEAPNADASIAVHKEAHGLLPDSIAEVSEGR